MLELIDQPMMILFAVCMGLSLLSFKLLAHARNLKNNFLRNFLYVPARKSTSNAIQLGGLPLALSIVVSLAGYLLVFEDQNYFPPIDRSILKSWLFCSLGIIFYGYLDDKYEFRPIVKLASQVTCIFTYAFFTSMLFLSIDSRLAFIITFVGGMIIINGGNLLDGLDTLTVKNSFVTLGAFFIIGGLYHSYPIVMISLLMMIPLSVFWLYNREPSRMQLGEIGGTFIGFSYILLSSLTFKWIGYRHDSFEAFSYAFIPVSLPLVEVFVSTARRLYNKKSPMSGDQLHVHHILNKYKKFSHSKSSNIIAGMNLLTTIVAVGIGYQTFALLGVLAVLALQFVISLYIGMDYWKGENVLQLNPKSIFSSLRKDNITVIESSHVENFKLTVVNSVDSDEELEDESDTKPPRAA